MLRRKQELKVTSRRPASDFFSRMIEAYERKFDGFPARVIGAPVAMPAAEEGSLEGVDIQAIIDAIARAEIDANNTPVCPDTPPGSIGNDCYTDESDAVTTNEAGHILYCSYFDVYDGGGSDIGMAGYGGCYPDESAFEHGGMQHRNLCNVHNSKAALFYDDADLIDGQNYKIRAKAAWLAPVGLSVPSVNFTVWKDVRWADSFPGSLETIYNGGTPVGNISFSATHSVVFTNDDTDYRYYVCDDVSTLYLGAYNASTGNNFDLNFEEQTWKVRFADVGERGIAGGMLRPSVDLSAENVTHYTNVFDDGKRGADLIQSNYNTACDGQVTKTELELTDTDPITYSAPFPVDYFTEVYGNGLIMVRDIDYEVSGSTIILPDGTDTDDLVVTARYVVGGS